MIIGSNEGHDFSLVHVDRNDVWTPYWALVAIVDFRSNGLGFGLVNYSIPQSRWFVARDDKFVVFKCMGDPYAVFR